MDQLASILVAVDFSTCSAAAFQQAARIAAWNQASLAAMHVVPMPAYASESPSRIA
jgi:nucleotide-binding universal stress UspA family protein